MHLFQLCFHLLQWRQIKVCNVDSLLLRRGHCAGINALRASKGRRRRLSELSCKSYKQPAVAVFVTTSQCQLQCRQKLLRQQQHRRHNHHHQPRKHLAHRLRSSKRLRRQKQRRSKKRRLRKKPRKHHAKMPQRLKSSCADCLQICRKMCLWMQSSDGLATMWWITNFMFLAN